MKAFIVYVNGHKESEKQAEAARASCYQSGFDAELFPGTTPESLSDFPDWPDAKNSRVSNFKRESKTVYQHKKSCFANHYRIWNKCLELNEPVAFLEHDVGNVRKWMNTFFDELLILNAESAFKQPVFDHVRNKPWLNFGTNEYVSTPLNYRFQNQWEGSGMMPGTGAYAIKPAGAIKLLAALDEFGWEQSDFFINTTTINIEYIVPEYFTFKSKNLNMSHGY